jgi:predicted XRE-type DNA-binding protein
MGMDEKRKYLRKYLWSSYRGYLSPSSREGFLQVEEVLAYWGGDTAKGRKSYEKFVIEGMSGKIPNPLEKGIGHGIIGESDFIEKIRGKYIQSVTETRELPAVKKILAQVEPERIIRVICEAYKEEREELLRKGYKGIGRGVLMEMLYRYGGMKQREIGELMGIDYSAVSVMRKRLSERQSKDRRLLALVERLKKRLQTSQE